MAIIFRVLIVCMLSISADVAAESFFDFSASTPEGSWAVREITMTDHKGRQSVIVMKQKFLGSEQREGQTYYWLETEMDNYKLKKGKRKRDGEHMIMKVLVSKEAMNSDPANVVNNLQGFSQEIIMQSGDDQPVNMSGGGLMVSAALKAFDIKIKYQFTVEGEETIDTAIGQFKTKRVSGTGSSSVKILFKKIETKSQSLMWISDEVPFGIVRGEATDTINGKEEHSKTVLTEYANSGAVTAINGEVVEMPF